MVVNLWIVCSFMRNLQCNRHWKLAEAPASFQLTFNNLIWDIDSIHKTHYRNLANVVKQSQISVPTLTLPVCASSNYKCAKSISDTGNERFVK